MAFTRGNTFLPAYIEACERRASAGPVHRTALGPGLLATMNQADPLPQIETVPTLSPLMIYAVYHSAHDIVREFKEMWNAPIHAAHLCRSLGPEGGASFINPEWHEEVVARLAADPKLLIS